MMPGGGIRGPSVGIAGTNVTVEVDGAGSVAVAVPGAPMTQVPVRDGTVTLPLPPNAPVGSQVHVILLGRLPPIGLSITIIAK